MAAFQNPALERFLEQIAPESVIAQVRICRQPHGFELRHVADRSRPAGDLRGAAVEDLRAIAQLTDSGAYRPLKSAPNLARGWVVFAREAEELERALNILYPGFLADWFAVHSGSGVATSYREFTARQTGMYRITTHLSDVRATQCTRACCHVGFCLKQRLWTVPGLAPDASNAKSIIPCLEPCAILLEFARRVARIDQEEKIQVEFTPSDLATLISALETALQFPETNVREADFQAPENKRHWQRMLEMLRDSGGALLGAHETMTDANE
ncbi:MAG: DR2241 family protein [Verrucomicrobiota bacterium]